MSLNRIIENLTDFEQKSGLDELELMPVSTLVDSKLSLADRVGVKVSLSDRGPSYFRSNIRVPRQIFEADNPQNIIRHLQQVGVPLHLRILFHERIHALQYSESPFLSVATTKVKIVGEVQAYLAETILSLPGQKNDFLDQKTFLKEIFTQQTRLISILREQCSQEQIKEILIKLAEQYAILKARGYSHKQIAGLIWRTNLDPRIGSTTFYAEISQNRLSSLEKNNPLEILRQRREKYAKEIIKVSNR